MMKETKTIYTKEELKEFRSWLKDKGYTEVKLLYRAGKYLATYATTKLTTDDLINLGYRKRKPQSAAV